jgi:hypothetical protein
MFAVAGTAIQADVLSAADEYAQQGPEERGLRARNQESPHSIRLTRIVKCGLRMQRMAA